MSNVAVLGSSGMLGLTMAKFLANSGHYVLEMNRTGVPSLEKNEVIQFSVEKHYELEKKLSGQKIDYIINCIGLIKQRFDEHLESDARLAVEVNSNFPYHLQGIVNKLDIKLIQIGTDCVFSGARGGYTELDQFDAEDLYGKTKLSGEQKSRNSMILRSSIIGIEKGSSFSLLSWLLSQPAKSEIHGFINHFWNGVTTLQFAQIVSGIISADCFAPGVSHLIPNNVVTKHQILKVAAKAFGREDLRIREFEARQSVNRSLATCNSTRNRQLWALGGYNEIPKVEEMILDYSSWFNSGQTQS